MKHTHRPFRFLASCITEELSCNPPEQGCRLGWHAYSHIFTTRTQLHLQLAQIHMGTECRFIHKHKWKWKKHLVQVFGARLCRWLEKLEMIGAKFVSKKFYLCIAERLPKAVFSNKWRDGHLVLFQIFSLFSHNFISSLLTITSFSLLSDCQIRACCHFKSLQLMSRIYV